MTDNQSTIEEVKTEEQQEKQESTAPPTKPQKDTWLDIDHFDVIILGTGLTESFLAGYVLILNTLILQKCTGSSWKNCSSFRQK